MKTEGDKMPILQPEDFEKKLRSDKSIKNIYYIYGRDTGVVSRLSKLVKKKILGEGYTDSDYMKIDFKNFSMSSFTDTVEIYPMFSEYNFIELNDFNAEELNAEELKIFLNIMDNIPSQTVILISITGFDIKGGKKAPGAKNKKVIDAAEKYGLCAEAEFRKPQEMSSYITEIAAKNGCTISKQNAEMIAQMCLGNTLQAENETEKLCAYADGSEITGEMIEEMVTQSLDTTSFALASAVASFNTHTAFKILGEVMDQRIECVVVLSALSSAFMDLYRAKSASESAVSINDAAADFGYRGREFVMKNAFRDAKKTSCAHLRRCLDILCRADLECKSTRLDQRIIIEKAIAQMFMCREGTY